MGSADVRPEAGGLQYYDVNGVLYDGPYPPGTRVRVDLESSEKINDARRRKRKEEFHGRVGRVTKVLFATEKEKFRLSSSSSFWNYYIAFEDTNSQPSWQKETGCFPQWKLVPMPIERNAIKSEGGSSSTGRG